MTVQLTRRRLRPETALRELTRRGSGGVALFLGAVRADRTSAGTVRALWYEADETMGRPMLEKLAARVLRRPGIQSVVLWHRLGRLRVGEVAVIVGASAAHRAPAFDAARELIERVKREIPIWKTDRVRPARRPRRRRAPRRGPSRGSGRARRPRSARRSVG